MDATNRSDDLTVPDLGTPDLGMPDLGMPDLGMPDLAPVALDMAVSPPA
jgi:hypothetical protein